MPKSIVYCRYPLKSVDEGAHQVFGDLLFFPNGSVQLGPKWFGYRVPIHRHRFGANLVAIRLFDEPNNLRVETPLGRHLYFLYRPYFRCWYQLVEVDDPRFYLHRDRYGFRIAVLLEFIWNSVASLRSGVFYMLRFFLGFLLLAVICQLFLYIFD